MNGGFCFVTDAGSLIVSDGSAVFLCVCVCVFVFYYCGYGWMMFEPLGEMETVSW